MKNLAAPPTSEEPKAPAAGDPPKEPEASKDDNAPTVPDKYEFKLPEGMTLSEETNTKVQELFKGLGLSQENAQKLVDFHTAELQAVANAGAEQVTAMQTKWREDAVKDPAIGDGKSGLKPEVAARLKNGIDALGPDLARSFREAMDETGMGNHPAIIKGIDAFAQRITEGTHVSGGGPSNQPNPGRPASGPQAMYPHLPSGAR